MGLAFSTFWDKLVRIIDNSNCQAVKDVFSSVFRGRLVRLGTVHGPRTPKCCPQCDGVSGNHGHKTMTQNLMTDRIGLLECLPI
jgi:hypothetical protein